MDGKQNAAFFHASFIALGLVLGDAHADECSRDATQGATSAGSSQRGHNRTRCNQRAYARNSERANARQPSQCAAEYRSGARSCGGSFRRFSVFLVSEVFRAFVLGKKN